MEVIILILLFGIGVSYVGYGPLSLKKNPTAGAGFAIVGFILRLAGPLILIVGVLLLATALFWNMP